MPLLSLRFLRFSFKELVILLCLTLYEPHKNVSSDFEPFIIPDLPGQIECTISRVSEFEKQVKGYQLSEFFKAMKEAEQRSYGVLVNSFYELEPAYADHYRKVLGRKALAHRPAFLIR